MEHHSYAQANLVPCTKPEYRKYKWATQEDRKIHFVTHQEDNLSTMVSSEFGAFFQKLRQQQRQEADEIPVPGMSYADLGGSK